MEQISTIPSKRDNCLASIAHTHMNDYENQVFPNEK